MFEDYPIKEECEECLRRRREREYEKHERDATFGVRFIGFLIFGGMAILAILTFMDQCM